MDSHKQELADILVSRAAVSLIRDHKLKTPFLFLNEQHLIDALDLFSKYLPDIHLLYAAKANSSLNVMNFFAERGLSMDVASVGEIASARSLNISGNRIFLSTPVKTLETIHAMFLHEVSSFAVDTISEIEKIAAYKKAHQFKHSPKVFVRIRIESRDVEVDLNTKFGCSLAEALEIIGRAAELNFEIGGICFHVGSQSTSPDNYFIGIESAMLIAKEATRRFKIKIPVINIGGGFCDAVAAKKAGLNVEEFYRSIGEACRDALNAGFTLFAEPGRCLVSSAGSVVTSVLGTSMRAGQKWAYLDDGIYGCFSIKLYENHPFHFIKANSISEAISNQIQQSNSKSWTMAGPTCDSLDVIAEHVMLGNLAIGDVLVVPNMGAYTISTASQFNGFQLPRCYIARAENFKGKVKTHLIENSFAVNNFAINT